MFRLSEVAMGRHVLEGSILDGLVPLLVLSLSVMLVAIHAIKMRMLSKTKQAQSGEQTTSKASRSTRRRHKAGRSRKPNVTAVKLQTVPQRDGLRMQQLDVLEETSSEPEADAPAIEADVERAEVTSFDLTGIEPVMHLVEHAGNGNPKTNKSKRNKPRAAKVQECQGQVIIPVAASESEGDEEEAAQVLAEEQCVVGVQPVFNLGAVSVDDDEKALSEAPTTAPEEDEEHDVVTEDAQEHEWGCSSSQVYYRELLLAHRSISLKIARGPPGLHAPAPKENAQLSSDCIGVLGIRTDPCSKHT
mmetsp:Transcript_58743/g.108400  ORF Transcript_58743/g.108400 Transcript_58743/m.108400 type:complete len:303 (-) Transcript_58743:20-928(-)